MLYSVSNLVKRYNDRTVLDVRRLEIEANRIYGLLGPNGAGKTTLINILSFLEPPTQGEVFYRSKKVRYTESILRELRKTVIVVDQTPILFSTSVYRNLEFGLKIRKIEKVKRNRIIHDALERVGMSAFVEAPAHRLSGGETQRVALARALALSPSMLLCDEPTASVDAENQTAIINILKDINQEKQITILFTSHDRSQALSLADQIFFLDNGMLTNGNRDNCFRADIRKIGEKRIEIRINDNLRLILADNLQLPDGLTQIVIDPEKPILSDPGDDPVNDNVALGRVTQVREEKEKIRILIDFGISIALVMSKQAYQSQHPMIGDQVAVLFPPDSIQAI